MTAFDGQVSSKHIDRHNEQTEKRKYRLKDRGEMKDRRKKLVPKNIGLSLYAILFGKR